MQFLFLPALASGVERMFRVDAAMQFKDIIPLLKWTHDVYKGTPVHYPHLLLSYYYFRRSVLALPPGYIFGDCGGFSVRRYSPGEVEVDKIGMKPLKGPPHTNIDPVDVIHWQASYCTVGALVDIPPVNNQGKQIFHAALNTTLQNTKRALPAYQALQEEGHDFKWWGVAHGASPPELELWWKTIQDVYPFTEDDEGWCFSARIEGTSHNPVAIAKTLRFVHQHQIPRVHFFAAAGAAAAAVLCALGPKAGVKFASVDSKGPFDMAFNRKILLPNKDGLAYKDMFEMGEDTSCRDFLLEKCPCHSCDDLRTDFDNHKTIINEDGYNEYWRYRFCLHNLERYILMFNNIEAAAREDPDGLLRTVLDNRYEEAMFAFHSRGLTDFL